MHCDKADLLLASAVDIQSFLLLHLLLTSPLSLPLRRLTLRPFPNPLFLRPGQCPSFEHTPHPPTCAVATHASTRRGPLHGTAGMFSIALRRTSKRCRLTGSLVARSDVSCSTPRAPQQSRRASNGAWRPVSVLDEYACARPYCPFLQLAIGRLTVLQDGLPEKRGP